MFKTLVTTIFTIFSSAFIFSQTININASNTSGFVPDFFKPSVSWGIKTNQGGNDYLNNGIHYNTIRLYIIEDALNAPNVNSIAGVMQALNVMKPGVLMLKQRCDNFIVPILKMPKWLSSSSNTTIASPSGDANWPVYSSHPPANYAVWNVLMDSVVKKINTQWGLNVYFEIWNEPDNFYWLSTENEYFKFFKNTLFSIKNNNPTAKVGGPVLSTFRSCFNLSLPSGYLSTSQFNQTIIGKLLDSLAQWNKKLDFMSWHNFNPFIEPLKTEISLLNNKLVATGHGTVPLILSEVNQNQSLRDTYYSTAFLTSYLIELEKNKVDRYTIAAIQDFDSIWPSSASEFHHDYGLLSWGGFHKTSYKSMLLLNKVRGSRINLSLNDSVNFGALAAKSNDTLRIIISNYSLPAYYRAVNTLYFQYQFNSQDLINAGFTSDAHLDSIFRGLINLPVTGSLSSAINQIIPLYAKYDSLFKHGKTLKLNINGLTGSVPGRMWKIDSTQNNTIFRYDSLVLNGYSRAQAISYLSLASNSISSTNVSSNDSTFMFHLKSNAVALVEFYMTTTGIRETSVSKNKIFVSPNPSNDIIRITSNDAVFNSQFCLRNVVGVTVKQVNIANSNEFYLNIADLPEGLYFLCCENKQFPTTKIIKN